MGEIEVGVAEGTEPERDMEMRDSVHGYLIRTTPCGLTSIPELGVSGASSKQPLLGASRYSCRLTAPPHLDPHPGRLLSAPAVEVLLILVPSIGVGRQVQGAVLDPVQGELRVLGRMSTPALSILVEGRGLAVDKSGSLRGGEPGEAAELFGASRRRGAAGALALQGSVRIGADVVAGGVDTEALPCRRPGFIAERCVQRRV